MELARYVVDAVVLEGRSYREVAATHGVSKSWVSKVIGRYRTGGYAAIVPRSRAPHSVPSRLSVELEDQIVLMRKTLTEDGQDAGAGTIHYHLGLMHDRVPSVSTIWRVLRRRGFVLPQPQKRPRSSWVRFEASLPNECWQSDMTHWSLGDGSHVEIVNFIDDYSRLALASVVLHVTTARQVVEVFRNAGGIYGFPASVLTDNGAVYTASYRGGRAALETELLARGIAFKHSRPYHPQTCGKVERFHQTLKNHLAKQDPPASIAQLQAQIDRFIAYYNTVRPHRARDRMTPAQAFDSRDKARPQGPKLVLGKETRVRHDIVDKTGALTLRYRSRLHHIGIGRALRGTRVVILVAGLEVKVLDENGQILRQLTLDPSRDYQPTGKRREITMG